MRVSHCFSAMRGWIRVNRESVPVDSRRPIMARNRSGDSGCCRPISCSRYAGCVTMPTRPMPVFVSPGFSLPCGGFVPNAQCRTGQRRTRPMVAQGRTFDNAKPAMLRWSGVGVGSVRNDRFNGLSHPLQRMDRARSQNRKIQKSLADGSQ